MNEPLRVGNLEACDKFRLLRQEYESALCEEALYDPGGAASIEQTIRYGNGAIAASAIARDRLIAHYKGCPRCKMDRALTSGHPHL
jgi:hypothetical protein